jgi:hypothetical protein
MNTNLKKSVLSIAFVAMAMMFNVNVQAANGSDTTKMAKKKMDKMAMKKEDKMKMDGKMSKDKMKTDKMKMKKDSSKMKM